MSRSSPSMEPSSRRRPPLTAVLDTVGSVPFGLTLMGALLVYCWIGSAGFAPFSDWFPRQSLEMTELEWFSWWPFKTLLISIAASMAIVTVRRIRFNVPNLGVWAVHIGVISLMAGTGYYFARKLEGDTAVYRFKAAIQAGAATTELMLQPGTRAFVYGDGRFYDVRVATIQPQYELLTGTDKGKRAYSVQFAVQSYIAGRPADAFVRQVIAGFPQYTEDLVPDQGRALKVVGRAILDDALKVDLVPFATDRFYVRDSAAVRLRSANDDNWAEYALPRLPRYAEHIGDLQSVDAAPGEPIASRTLDVHGETTAAPSSLTGLGVRATGFLPHARLEQTWEPGGSLRRPLAQVTVRASGNATRHVLLQPNGVTSLSTASGPLEAQLVWLDDAVARESQRAIVPPTVRVQVGKEDVSFLLADLMQAEKPVGRSGYTLRGLQFLPHWSLAESGEAASLVTIAVTHGDQRYTRAVVSPQNERSQDLDASGKRLGARIDESLTIELLNPIVPALKLVAGDWGVDLGLIGEDGKAEWTSARVGEAVEFQSRPLSITVDGLSRQSQRVMRPAIIPLRERDTKAGMAHALVRLELTRAGKAQRGWLEYSHYPHPNRYGYKPQRLAFEDGTVLEAVFTRESRPLPMKLSLAEFQLETYPGGQRERDYVSRIRFDDGQGWGEPFDIRSNVPTGHAGWWLFQSTWDPPSPEMGYSGLNFSGVGVANRHGVGAMLAGAVIVSFGLIWAFYVKPTLLTRRRAQRAHSQRGAGALAGALLLTLGCSARPQESVVPLSAGRPFREAVDLSAIRLIAVQDDGRVKTFDALARESLARAFGPGALADADPVLAYLDLMLVPEPSTTSTTLYAPKKAFRQRLVQIVRESTAATERRELLSDESLDRFLETGYCSAAFLDHPSVRDALGLLDRDLMSGSKEVQRLLRSRQLGDGRTLQAVWRVVPPPGGGSVDPWLPLHGGMDGGMTAALPNDDVHQSFHGGGLPASIEPKTRQALEASWAELQRAWRFQDASRASAALGTLANQLSAIEPALYPSSARRSIESWYLRMHKLTWAWLIYLAALVPLLFGITRQRPRALRLGFVLFSIGLALHTAAIGLRWYIAGRIPNSNMFEAVCASAWFGAVIALLLERVLRQHRVRGLPVLAAAVTGMTALMAGSFLPVGLSGDISPVMPILDRTIWLYIHTNVVITSYALIFCAGVVAALSLAARWSPAKRWASAGGEASPLVTCDGATMIFLQLAFVALWIGTVLGAVWADVSWGRPWGWDPKEVFALNTWLVFLMLIHVRLRARDKALWTAILALIGCAVMLFNWIAVNFVIVGLHSYA